MLYGNETLFKLLKKYGDDRNEAYELLGMELTSYWMGLADRLVEQTKDRPEKAFFCDYILHDGERSCGYVVNWTRLRESKDIEAWRNAMQKGLLELFHFVQMAEFITENTGD